MYASPYEQEHKNATKFARGRLEVIHNFVEMCVLMEEQLWDTGEKFRVTIECDPESKDFIMKREPVPPVKMEPIKP